MKKPSEDRGGGVDAAEYLPVVIALLGRIAFPETSLREVIGGKGKAAPKYISAYNKCDGTRRQTEIARESNLDPADMSKALKRWEAAGALFRVGIDAKPVKLYSLQNDGGEVGV